MRSSRRVVWPLAMGNKIEFVELILTGKKVIQIHFDLNSFKLTYIFIFSPYDNRWSKTMLGYGPESSHFHVELIYNYGVSSYDLGRIYLSTNCLFVLFGHKKK